MEDRSQKTGIHFIFNEVCSHGTIWQKHRCCRRQDGFQTHFLAIATAPRRPLNIYSSTLGPTRVCLHWPRPRPKPIPVPMELDLMIMFGSVYNEPIPRPVQISIGSVHILSVSVSVSVSVSGKKKTTLQQVNRCKQKLLVLSGMQIVTKLSNIVNHFNAGCSLWLNSL